MKISQEDEQRIAGRGTALRGRELGENTRAGTPVPRVGVRRYSGQLYRRRPADTRASWELLTVLKAGSALE